MGYRKGFNKYTVFGDYTVFYITNKKLQHFEVYIDTEDLQRLIDLDLSWTAEWKDDIQSYYIHTTKYLGKIDGKYKYQNIELHRFITNAEKGMCVDHKDYDGLNNRKYNLRVTTYDKNLKHRDSKNENNTSGYRNVSLNSKTNLWMVQLQVDGKNTCLMQFPYDKLDDAGAYAEKMRKEIYGSYKGRN